ncbi:MAG TPA: hypothetical protein ACQGQH_10065 [Xylella sp.]
MFRGAFRRSGNKYGVIDYLHSVPEDKSACLDGVVQAAKKNVKSEYETHLNGLKEYLNSEKWQIPDEFPVSRLKSRGGIEF